MSLLQPVRRAKTRALWLQEALVLEPGAASTEPLSGAHRADVCIVGGGYTGLWTALHIKWLDPSVDVMLLEADFCGAGASGRNGGFVNGWWEKLPSLVHTYGEEEGVRLAREAAAGVAAIGRVCAEFGIDADYRPGGVLITATARPHLGNWEHAVRAAQDRGFDVFTVPEPGEVARRAGSPSTWVVFWIAPVRACNRRFWRVVCAALPSSMGCASGSKVRSWRSCGAVPR